MAAVDAIRAPGMQEQRMHRIGFLAAVGRLGITLGQQAELAQTTAVARFAAGGVAIPPAHRHAFLDDPAHGLRRRTAAPHHQTGG